VAEAARDPVEIAVVGRQHVRLRSSRYWMRCSTRRSSV
jgi:hypothetical protein